MAETKKYYTPEIEEFHFGFECEIMSSYGWQKGVWPKVLQEETLNNFDKDIVKQTNTSTFRVKCLDREDIESMGFELQYPDLASSSFINKGIYEAGACSIGLRGDNLVGITIFHHPNASTLVFIIKNKSELKTILKQLGVTQQHQGE
tara:strand:- start:19625 stop:20065 length:441 start_codon:yes stop_codon:yes gene_type:complete